MPCEIRWEAPNGVYKKHTGFVGAEEFVRSTESLHADPRFDSLRYVINDGLELEGTSVSEDSLDYLAALWLGGRYSNKDIRIAFLTTNETILGMIRRYQDSGVLPFPVAAFSSLDEARSWINSKLP